MEIIIFGPPGAGKGTQAGRIKEEFNIAHLSTGRIFREAINHETTLGKKVESILDSGRLVPDELVSALVEEELCKPEYDDGYVLDGFPRTIGQAKAYDCFLDGNNEQLNACLFLNVPEQELIKRILSRGEGRSDDTEEKVKTRLQVYRDKTEPVREHYEKQGVVKTIGGVGSVDEVFGRIKTTLIE